MSMYVFNLCKGKSGGVRVSSCFFSRTHKFYSFLHNEDVKVQTGFRAKQLGKCKENSKQLSQHHGLSRAFEVILASNSTR